MHSNKIKLLYLGAFGKHCSDSYRVQGIKNSELYNLVASVDYRQFKKQNGDKFDFEISKIIVDTKPDVLLMNKAEVITVDDIRFWKRVKPDMVIAYWYGDMREELAGYVIDKLPVVDAFLTNAKDRHYTKEISEFGIDEEKIFFSHTATDSDIFKKDEKAKEIYDIIFFGGNYGNKFPHSKIRVDFIKRLINEDIYNIKIFGQGWNRLGDAEKPVYGEEFAKQASKAKIILGFSSFLNINGYTSNRIWNSMACGFHLTHEFLGIASYFKKDIDLSWFNNYSEMKKSINFYLKHDKIRKEIYYTGREVVARDHTYEARAVEMYSIFKTLIKEKTSVKI